MTGTTSQHDIYCDSLRNAHAMESPGAEKRMAAAIHDNLDPVTRQFITQIASGDPADIKVGQVHAE